VKDTVISIGALRHANSYAHTGCFGADSSAALDELIIEHLTVQRELAKHPELDQTMLMAAGCRRKELLRFDPRGQAA
jgi:hypothetical protein